MGTVQVVGFLGDGHPLPRFGKRSLVEKDGGEEMRGSSQFPGWLGCGAAVSLVAVCGSAAVHAVAAWEKGGTASLTSEWAVGIVDLTTAVLFAALGAVAAVLDRRRRQSERAKRAYWGVLESALDGLLVLDGTNRILFASRAAEGLFCYAPGELVGRALEAVLPRRSPREEPQRGAPSNLAEGDAAREVAGQRKDGGELTLNSRQAVLAWDGHPCATVILLRDITKNRRTREVLCAQEAHLRLVVEQMPAILWTTDKDLHITSTLGAGLAALNLRAKEVIGMSMLECLERDDVESTPIAAHLKAVRGESINYEMEWKGRAFQVRVDPLRNTEKRVVGTVGILLDVTERKLAVAELKARERQQAAVADLGLRALTGPELGVLMDAAVVAVSRTLGVESCAVLEFSPEDKGFRVSAACGWALQHGAPATAATDSEAGYTLRAGEPVVVMDMAAERRFRPSQFLLDHGAASGVSTVILGRNGPLGVLAAHSAARRRFGPDDIHFLQAVANVIAAALERCQSEEVQARLVAILEATPDCVAIADKDQRLSYVNWAGRQMLGLGAREDVTGRALADFYPGELRGSVLPQAVRTAVSKGVWSGEAALLTRAGKQVPVSQVMLSHRAPGGAVRFLSAIARDLSEHLRLEEQFRQAQKMEAFGRLAGGVAHDFNNLLCIITGYSTFLLQGLSEEDRLRGCAEQIHKAGERAAALTRQLLAFSRKQMLVPRTLNLNALVTDMDKMLQRLIGEDIELITALNPTLWPVKADPGQVEQVLMNLTVNARDAMPQGGRLTLSTSNAVLDPEALPGRLEVRPGSYVVLAVSDTGCGMGPEVLGRLFEPFFTTKPVGKGTGLGLATVYGIIKQSGGHIEVDSEPGRGTTFKVYLPQVEEPGPRPGQSDAADAEGGTETVLLVEDEEGVRSLAGQVLRQKGYRVLEACDGKEALAVCERYQGQIDLLLTDAVMPRLSGGNLAKQVRSLLPRTKVLFMSASRTAP